MVNSVLELDAVELEFSGEEPLFSDVDPLKSDEAPVRALEAELQLRQEWTSNFYCFPPSKTTY